LLKRGGSWEGERENKARETAAPLSPHSGVAHTESVLPLGENRKPAFGLRFSLLGFYYFYFFSALLANKKKKETSCETASTGSNCS